MLLGRAASSRLRCRGAAMRVAPRRSLFAWWRENVIKPIHGTRIALPDLLGVPATSYMQLVYPVPVVVGGYYVMQWAIGKSHDSIGAAGEKLRDRPNFRPAPARGGFTDDQKAAIQKLLGDAKGRKGGS